MTKFSNNFSYLLEKPCYISDVTIEVMGENDSNIMHILIILYAKSEYIKEIKEGKKRIIGK